MDSESELLLLSTSDWKDSSSLELQASNWQDGSSSKLEDLDFLFNESVDSISPMSSFIIISATCSPV